MSVDIEETWYEYIYVDDELIIEDKQTSTETEESKEPYHEYIVQDIDEFGNAVECCSSERERVLANMGLSDKERMQGREKHYQNHQIVVDNSEEMIEFEDRTQNQPEITRVETFRYDHGNRVLEIPVEYVDNIEKKEVRPRVVQEIIEKPIKKIQKTVKVAQRPVKKVRTKHAVKRPREVIVEKVEYVEPIPYVRHYSTKRKNRKNAGEYDWENSHQKWKTYHFTFHTPADRWGLVADYDFPSGFWHVEEVLNNSQAQRLGVKKGMAIVAVNGEEVNDINREYLGNILRARRSCSITFDTSMQHLQTFFFQHDLYQNPWAMSIDFRSGHDHGVILQTESGQAEENGVKKGDKLHAINGYLLSQQENVVKDILRENGPCYMTFDVSAKNKIKIDDDKIVQGSARNFKKKRVKEHVENNWCPPF